MFAIESCFQLKYGQGLQDRCNVPCTKCTIKFFRTDQLDASEEKLSMGKEKFQKIKEWRISLWWFIKSHLALTWPHLGLCEVNLCEVRSNQTLENFKKSKNSKIQLFLVFGVFSCLIQSHLTWVESYQIFLCILCMINFKILGKSSMIHHQVTTLKWGVGDETQKCFWFIRISSQTCFFYWLVSMKLCLNTTDGIISGNDNDTYTPN